MNMGQFRDGMSKRIVQVAGRHIPAMNMGENPARCRCRQRTGHGLYTITENYHQVTAQLLQR